jgi:hypothetical protein
LVLKVNIFKFGFGFVNLVLITPIQFWLPKSGFGYIDLIKTLPYLIIKIGFSSKMCLISIKTIKPSNGFIINQLQNFKKFGIIKVGNKGANGIQ